MKDSEYLELQLKTTITPQQARWPEPRYVHWQLLHVAADTARSIVAEVLEKIAEIDKDPDLSPAGKARQRAKAAAEAIASLENDKALNHAREAVEKVMMMWSEKTGAIIKKPVDMHQVSLHQEIRHHVASSKNKLSFIEQHGSDATVLSALLTAPAFLSGLSEVELAAVKAKAESHLEPKIVEAKVATLKALKEAEAGWRRAVDLITERAGLTQGPDGKWRHPSMSAAA
jgi:hypothetical protein